MSRALLYGTAAILIAVASTVLLVALVRSDDRRWKPDHEQRYSGFLGILLWPLAFVGFVAAFVLTVLALVATDPGPVTGVP